VLLTDNKAATAEALMTQARAQGIAEVMVPRLVLTVPAVPLLATGKVDYPAVHTLTEERLAASRPAVSAANS
jgi:acyl-[acyl-carrier-protein]-phospholipid O-acyltransferase/long-chain-fatty-acid--[acyl-carrier-protein] ligase